MTTHQTKEKAIERREATREREEKSHSQAHRAHARSSPLRKQGKKKLKLRDAHTAISLANRK